MKKIVLLGLMCLLTSCSYLPSFLQLEEDVIEDVKAIEKLEVK